MFIEVFVFEEVGGVWGGKVGGYLVLDLGWVYIFFFIVCGVFGERRF